MTILQVLHYYCCGFVAAFWLCYVFWSDQDFFPSPQNKQYRTLFSRCRIVSHIIAFFSHNSRIAESHNLLPPWVIGHIGEGDKYINKFFLPKRLTMVSTKIPFDIFGDRCKFNSGVTRTSIHSLFKSRFLQCGPKISKNRISTTIFVPRIFPVLFMWFIYNQYVLLLLLLVWLFIVISTVSYQNYFRLFCYWPKNSKMDQP